MVNIKDRNHTECESIVDIINIRKSDLLHQSNILRHANINTHQLNIDCKLVRHI